MSLHSLVFRAFSHATEDEAKVAKALAFVSGTDEANRTESSGYHGNPIIVLETTIRDRQGIYSFFRRLGANSIRELLSTLEMRVDDQSFFYLRLDKQEAYLGALELSSGDDVIAVRGKVRAYPSRRDAALRIMDEHLRSFLDDENSKQSSP